MKRASNVCAVMDHASYCFHPCYIPAHSVYPGFVKQAQPCFVSPPGPSYAVTVTNCHSERGRTSKSGSSKECTRRRTRDFAKEFKAPFDMNTLRAAIQAANPGSDEIRKIIEACTFKPRERAFTRLINMCGRQKESTKCLEVFDVMCTSRSVRPNTYTYSALISACNNAGDFDAAIDVYHRMKTAALNDIECRPNQVTYNAVISASERGRKHDVCLSCFYDMMNSGAVPDSAACCSAIFACRELGKWEEAKRILSEMHSLKKIAAVGVYSMMIEHYANASTWNSALDIFLEMQKAGQNVDTRCCRGLMTALEAGKQPLLAYELVESMWANDIHVEKQIYASVLRILASAGMWEDAIIILLKTHNRDHSVPLESLKILIESMKAAGEYKSAIQVEEIMKKMDGSSFIDKMSSKHRASTKICSKYKY